MYASDTYAGAILEVLRTLFATRTLPGPLHAMRVDIVDIPDEVVESLAPEQLPRWDTRESPEARASGDRWLYEERSAVLAVPSVPARPIGRTLVINPRHPDAARIETCVPFVVPWDERLF